MTTTVREVPAQGRPAHRGREWIRRGSGGERVDRLTTAELMMLRPEEVGWREDIGAVAILDGDALLDDEGRLDVERVRAVIAGRIHRLPRFRQVLLEPRWWLGTPFWADAPQFSVDHHVRVAPLPAGAGDAELFAEVERLRARPFDRAHPLWELWLLPVAAERRVGMYVKLHHTIADGVAGVAQLAVLLDLDPEVTIEDPRPWSPTPNPTPRELFVDNVLGIVAMLGEAARGLVRPRETAAKLAETVGMLRDAFGQEPAPATSANRPIGQERLVLALRSRLDLFRSIAHAHDATVNDVLLAVVAGGYRSLLAGRGEAVDGLVLRASVPVSLHGEDHGAVSNDDAMLFAPLPVGIEDPSRRLDVVARETAAGKRQVRPAPAGRLMNVRAAQLAIWRRFDHQRWSNGYVANVPGPPLPLHLAGARLLEAFAVVPIMGNLTIGVGALSYDGQFTVTTVADAGTCPDVSTFVSGMRSTLDRLAVPTPIRG